ncbi:putative uncharacterized protein DDB_G0287457 [Teleopsis dalmanni]|uniref:putative uncharacterized protein DDB_G0287457 n=1 Tax=Teleopsis dalmanni TaxID=139649 RepID=UPI0018CFB8D7|nr:putative uncharacterized protein DDB_G0287457 [Teleopsis dalmanni]
MEEICERCYKKASHTCARCGEPYCSENCQRIDWPNHRLVCRKMPDLVPFVKYREEVYKELQPKKEISSERNIVHAYVDNHEDPNSNNHNDQQQHDQLVGPMTRKHFNNNEQHNDSKRYDQSNRLQESNVQQKWDREAVKDKFIDKQYEKDFSCDPQYPGIDAQSLRCDTKLDNVSEQNKWENRQEFNKGGDILNGKQCSSFRTSSTKYKQRHDYDEMGTTYVQNRLIYNEQCNKSQQNYKNIELQDYKVPEENFDTDIVEKDSGYKLSNQKYPDIDNQYLQLGIQLDNVSKQNKWENSKEFDQNNYKEIGKQSNNRNGFRKHDVNDIQVISDNSVQHNMGNSESFTHLPQQKRLDNSDGIGTSTQKSLSYNKQRNHSEEYNKNHELLDYKAVEEIFDVDIVEKNSGYKLSKQKYPDIDNEYLQRRTQLGNVSQQNMWENSKEFDQNNYKEIVKQSKSRDGFQNHDVNDIQVISDNSVQHNMDNSEYFTHLPQQKRVDNFDGIGTSTQKCLSSNKQHNHSEEYNKNHKLQNYKAIEETFNADIVKKDSGYALSNNQKYLDIDNGKLQRGIQFDNVSKQNKWENSKEFDQNNYKEIGKQSNSRNGFQNHDTNDLQVFPNNSGQHNMNKWVEPKEPLHVVKTESGNQAMKSKSFKHCAGDIQVTCNRKQSSDGTSQTQECFKTQKRYEELRVENVDQPRNDRFKLSYGKKNKKSGGKDIKDLDTDIRLYLGNNLKQRLECARQGINFLPIPFKNN